MGSTVRSMIEYQTVAVRDSLTRPANTTAYAAGDAVSDATDDAHLSFPGIVLAGPSRLSGAVSTAICYSSAAQGTLPDAELYLFRTDFSAVADNAAFQPSDAETLTCIGVIEFPVADWKSLGNNAFCVAANPGIAFQAESTTIYGQLVVQNAYTPVSGEIFTVELIVTQD